MSARTDQRERDPWDAAAATDDPWADVPPPVEVPVGGEMPAAEPESELVGASGTGVIPANVEAERAVLGSLLAGARLEHRDELLADDFWRPAHATVYACVRELADAGDPHDAVAVGEHLGRVGRLQHVGGLPYLHTLLAAGVGQGALGYHVDIVAEAATLRRLREAGIRVQQLAEHRGGAEVTDIVEAARGAVDDVARGNAAHDEHGGRGAYIGELIAARLRAYAEPRPAGLLTGWSELDAKLAGGVGLLPGQLVIVGARVGVGKSLIGVNLAASAARKGTRAALFSLEMTNDDITDRVIAADAGVRLERLQAHNLDDWDWHRVQRTETRLAAAPLYVDDRPGVTLATLRARCRDLTREEPRLGVVVVDYLQLITAADGRVDRRVQVDAISRGLKLLAKELAVPVVAMAQVNRNPTSRTEKTPQLSDLRESGALEQDADIVLLAHREDDHPGQLSVNIAKNRGGPASVSVELAWAPSLARLLDINRESA